MKSKFLTEAENNENIFKNYKIPEYSIIENMHNKNNAYHNWNHIDEVIFEIEQHTDLSPYEIDVLILTALFHDIVYDSTQTNNEELSAITFLNLCQLDEKIKNEVYHLILFSKYEKNPETDLEEIFMYCDINIFDKPISKQLEFEKLIQKEFAWVPFSIYLQKRIEILRKLGSMYFGNELNTLFDTSKLINYLENKKWNIGVYAGSFFPFHIGHADVLKQAEKIFDKVIILNSNNNRKESKTSFNWNVEKYGQLNTYLDNYEVHTIDSLITEELKKFETLGDVTLIRGLRNNSDLLYEQNYLNTLHDIDPNVKAIYFLTKPELSHVSSSMIRELIQINPELTKKYLFS